MKRTIRIKIPRNSPDSLVGLAKRILDCHDANPGGSPLGEDFMREMRNAVVLASKLRSESRHHFYRTFIFISPN